MRYVYITMVTIDESSGVYKKIVSQNKEFEKKGYKGELVFLSDLDNVKIKINGNFRDCTFSDVAQRVIDNKNDIAFAYIRFELLRHRNFAEIIRICRKENIKVISEIPTYPPYQESLARVKAYIGNKRIIQALKTFLGAGLVAFDTWRFAHLSDVLCIVASDKKFKGVMCLRIENGIDLESNPFSGIKENTATINIVAVSNFAVWNGYDRAILGLEKYIAETGNRDIQLTFVGPIEKAGSLIEMTEKLKLDDNIKFLGSLSGDALNKVYSEADVALGALGNHRRKVKSNSSLKAKEYAARGKLMILADNEGTDEFIFKRSFVVSSDETPVDFSEFKKWFKKLNSKGEVCYRIHEYARNNFTWEEQINRIIRQI